MLGYLVMKLTPAFLSSVRFSYSKNDYTFYAEMSDLPRRFIFRPLYDDAADVGFAIVSRKTGNVRTFSLVEEKQDGEGDILWWGFICVNPGRNEPITKVKIFND